MKRKRERIGLDFTKMELEKRVKIIGKVEMNEEEKILLALRKSSGFRIKNGKIKWF